MLQIKTIRDRLDYAPFFDQEVNKAVAEGWTLTRRDVLQPRTGNKHTMLYAELERHIITESERCCENCRHYNALPHAEPCCSCGENADKWEPAT